MVVTWSQVAQSIFLLRNDWVSFLIGVAAMTSGG
jgi:hypothetical protein